MPKDDKINKQIRSLRKMQEKQDKIKTDYSNTAIDTEENYVYYDELDSIYFQELGPEEAFVALTELSLLAIQSSEEQQATKRELEAIWKEYQIYLTRGDEDPEIYLNRAKFQVIAQRRQRNSNDENSELEVSHFVNCTWYKWHFVVPKNVQDKLPQGILKVNHERSVRTDFLEMGVFFFPVKFAITSKDQRVVKELRLLDQMLSNNGVLSQRTNAVERFTPLLTDSFSRWLAVQKVESLIENHSYFAGIILQELYASFDFEPLSISRLTVDFAERFAERVFILSVTTNIDRFIYGPFVFLLLLEYLNNIGYFILDEEIREILLSLQETIEHQIKHIEGDMHLSRAQLLAAAYFGYSYYNYEGHRGNLRYDTLMPRDMYILEAGHENNIGSGIIADKLGCSLDEAKKSLSRFAEVKKIVDAESPTQSFKAGLTQDLKGLFKDLDPKVETELIQRICYRASDLLYLIERDCLSMEENCEELTTDQTVTDS